MFLRTEQAGALIKMPVVRAPVPRTVYVPLPPLTGWIHGVASLTRRRRCLRRAVPR